MLSKLTVGVGFPVYLDGNSSLQPASISVYYILCRASKINGILGGNVTGVYIFCKY